jgi:predicted kinase
VQYAVAANTAGLASPRHGGPAVSLCEDNRLLACAALFPHSTTNSRSCVTRWLFALKTHRETKQLPVYLLTAAKGGPKLRESTAPSGSGTRRSCGHLAGTRITTDVLATVLSRQFEREVLNRPEQARVLSRTARRCARRSSLPFRSSLGLNWRLPRARRDSRGRSRRAAVRELASVPKRFIVVSGLPASGKTTLALRLGPALSLPVIDKDAILDRLFERDGPGDEFWRRTLSRKSDLFFEAAAIASKGALLVSHWRVPGMRKNSGTSLAWLDGHLINVHCVCSPEIAAARFVARKRHPGHLDANRTYDELLEQFRELERLGPPRIERSIKVDTSEEPDLKPLLVQIATAAASFDE